MSSERKTNPPRQRLDAEMVRRKMVLSRSQAENYIKLGKVKVNEQIRDKAGWPTSYRDKLEIDGEQYVSRAALKLVSVADKLGLEFTGKVVLDVGSSTGGFTDYALRRGAEKVIAVDVGTDQLHPRLRADERVDLYEKTDIRDFTSPIEPDMVLVDVSFISLRQVLPAISRIAPASVQILAMVKPQFESGAKSKHKGVVKNDSMRRQILKDFEAWARQHFVIVDKADAEVTGDKGNRERFYSLKSLEGHD